MNFNLDKDILIFDIDGTLVDSSDFDNKLYIDAVKHVLGDVFIHDDWEKYEYLTDSGILAQIMAENGIHQKEKIMRQVRDHFGELVSGYLHKNSCAPAAGALQAVANYVSSPGYAVGFATGGWGHTALMKLKAAGFAVTGIPLFSADDHYDRVEIMNACKKHISPGADNVVYFGDGPWDLKAARKLRWGFIGVGPKIKETAEVWIPHFSCAGLKNAPGSALRQARAAVNPGHPRFTA